MRFIRTIKKKNFFHAFCFCGVFSRYFKAPQGARQSLLLLLFNPFLLYFIRQKIAQTIGLYGGRESYFERFVCGGSNALEKKGAIEQSRVQNQSFEEDLKRYAKKDADSSIGWRLERWKEALTVLRLRPFLVWPLARNARG